MKYLHDFRAQGIGGGSPVPCLSSYFPDEKLVLQNEDHGRCCQALCSPKVSESTRYSPYLPPAQACDHVDVDERNLQTCREFS